MGTEKGRNLVQLNLRTVNGSRQYFLCGRSKCGGTRHGGVLDHSEDSKDHKGGLTLNK